MSTHPDTPTPDISTQQTAPLSVRSAAAGFLWGAVALAILAWWLYARNFDPSLPFWGGTAAVAGACLVLFIWYMATLLRAKGNVEVLRAAEAKMRPVFSVVLFAGAAVLLALGVWIYVKEKSQGFAEFSSLTVMALLAAGAGASLRLSWSGPAMRQRVLDTMLQMRKQMALVLMILGAALVVVGVWFAVHKGWSEFRNSFPEGGGMFLVGLVLFSAGLWTNLTLDNPATAYTMRMLLLYVGGLTGFLIAIMTALRIVFWWTTYFAGGMRVWQGEEGWRFWVCAYVGLIGLGLLFGSLLLGQVDIRSSAPMRRLLYGYNAVLTGLLLLAMLVVANILIYVVLPSNIVWNKTMGMHSLSGRSKNLLETLKEPVKVYVLMTRYSDAYLELRDLLDNCQGVTNKIEVDYLSPDLDSERYRTLANTYAELKSQQSRGFKGGEGYGRGVLIVYGPGPDDAKLPHVFIPDSDLTDKDIDPRNPREVRQIVFKGEEVIMQQINLLANKNIKLTVYFTQDNREPLLIDSNGERSDPRYDPRLRSFAGLGELADKLRKDNFVVRGLLWGVQPKQFPENLPVEYKYSQDVAKGSHKIPDDCGILVIVNPDTAFSKEVLLAIDDYMDKRTGKLIVLSRLGVYSGGDLAKDGMDELCKRYGVLLNNDYVLTYPPDPVVLRAKATVPDGPGNKIKFAREFASTSIIMITPRTMQAAPQSLYQAEPILEVASPPNGKNCWAETELKYYGNPLKYIAELQTSGRVSGMGAKKPLTVGMAVTDRDMKQRAVILGDYWPVCNLGVITSRDNYDFFRSSMEWLAARQVEPFGASPRKTDIYEADRERVSANMNRMIWLPIALTVLSMIGTGAGVWIVRRK